jgi:DNA (cytosine-5)-methyltransferase 1
VEDRVPTAIGCYIFAGGFTTGVKQAGFDILAHLEGDSYGVSTAKLNFPGMPIYVGTKNWPLSELAGKVDFIACNPPCSPWSANGKRSQGRDVRGMGAWRSDPRVACWGDCFEAFRAIGPRALAIESVCPVYTDGRDMIDDYTRKALMLGYSVTHLLIDAQHSGIAQSRKRFFFVAHRPVRLAITRGNEAPALTVEEVLAEVADPGWVIPTSKTHLPLMDAMRPGDSLAATWERVTLPENKVRGPNGKMTGKPFASNRVLPLDRTMGAFTGNTLYHPTDKRALGIEEAKAMCGFPPEFQLAEPKSGWWALLARGVMPPVGAWLARAVLETLRLPDGGWADRCVTRLDLRKDIGSEPVDLTSEYLNESGKVRIRVRAATNAIEKIAEAIGPLDPGSVRVTEDRPPTPPVAAPRPIPKRLDAAPKPRGTVGRPPDDPSETPLAGEGSGAFIRRLWMTGNHTPDALVALVHKSWAGRTTAVGDVRYNYYRLIDSGIEGVPPWPGPVRRNAGVTRAAVFVAPVRAVTTAPNLETPCETEVDTVDDVSDDTGDDCCDVPPLGSDPQTVEEYFRMREGR